MKRILYTLASVACAAMAFTSCSNDDAMEGNVPEPVMQIAIEAGTPEVEPETRTELNGIVPMWSVGDKIGVVNESDAFETLTSTATAASKTTTFKGTVPMSTTTLYPFYPSANQGVNTDKNIKMDIPDLQHPTETSFDGAADMLIGKPIAVAAGVDIMNLKTPFARVIGVLKVNVKSVEAIIGENLEHLSVSVDKSEAAGFAGRVSLDVRNSMGLTSLYYNQSMKVSAEYASENQFALNGTNGAYLCVYPQTLAAGTILTISGTTSGHNFKKEITLQNPIEILPGKQTNLNVTLNAEHISVRTSGAALPFSDDFSWAAGNESTEISDVKTDSKGNFIYSDKVYHGTGKVKFGSSKKVGVLRTKELDLSKAYTIIVGIELYNKKASSLAIKVDGVDTKKAAVLDKNGTYRFEMPAATENSTIELTRGASGEKRFYLNQIEVFEGHGNVELPANINVTSASPVEMGWIGGEGVINYTIDNPKQGTTIAATSTDNWITNINTSVEGTISFEVVANETGKVRTGNIKLSYGEAEPKTVEVKQDLKKDPVLIVADQTIKSDAGTYTFSYQVDNPDGSTMKVASTDAWISAVNASVAGEISFTVTANDTGVVRTGTITLTYGAITKTVKITQEPAGVAAETTVTITAEQIRDGGLGTGKVTVEGVTATVGDLTFTFKRGTGQNPSYFSGSQIRFYIDELLTISSVDGSKTIKHIEISKSKDGKVEDIDDPSDNTGWTVWNGSKKVLNLRATAQLRINSFKITYE